MVQALRAGERAKCVEFCNTVLRDIKGDNFLPRLIFSDETTFRIRGEVNGHSFRIWGLEHPKEILEHHRISRRLTCFVPLL